MPRSRDITRAAARLHAVRDRTHGDRQYPRRFRRGRNRWCGCFLCIQRHPSQTAYNRHDRVRVTRQETREAD